jgi:hypothetical protein
MSALGDAASRRPVPLLVAPSIEYVLLPTPPNTSPAAVVVPSAKPCDTSVCVGVGFTPAAKRVSMIGMFEIIGSDSTMRVSKVCADDTDDVSSSGASAVTVTSSVIPPISSVKGRLTCWPTPRAMPARVVFLNPCTSTVT